MEAGSAHHSSAGTSSVIKPVPMYYVDQFQRLYQQSPMAKVFQQGLTAKVTPKGPASKDGRSRNSTAAKNFKIPLLTPKTRTPAAKTEDSPPRVHYNLDLNTHAKHSGDPKPEEGQLVRTHDDSLLAFHSTYTQDNGLDSPIDHGGSSESRKSLLSPQPRLQSLPRQNDQRRRTPNLHSLIQKLASPDKERTPGIHPRSSVTNSGSKVANDICTPRNINHKMGYERQNNDVSGATTRTNQAKTLVNLDPDQTLAKSQEDTPEASIIVDKKKTVPQRRILDNSNDHATNPRQESERNSQYRMRRLDVRPRSSQTPRATPVSTLSPLVQPEFVEVPLTEDTPVNHRNDGLKARSRARKHNVAGLIRNLQAVERPGQDTLRSEVSFEGTAAVTQEAEEDENDNNGDVALDLPVEQKGSEDDLESLDDDKRTLDEETSKRIKSPNTETGEDIVCMNEAEFESSDRWSADGAREEEINIPVQIAEDDEQQRHDSTTSDDTPQIPKKKAETIINRWIVKPVPTCKGICVEGHRVGDELGQFWHSTAIMVCIKPRLLATKSGTLYRLSGKMDRALAMEQGFSESFVRSYQKGFPSNWRELLYDHFTDGVETKETRRKSDKLPSKKEPFGLSPVPSLVDQTVTDSVQKAKKKNPVDMTPQNLCIKDLHRSSSGRLIKPPLAYWTGQRIRHNTSLDFVEILSGTEDCTSASASKISLQESLEIGPRGKRAMRRTIKIEKSLVVASEKKTKARVKTTKYPQAEESEGDDTSSSCPDADMEPPRMPIIRNKQHEKDTARRATRNTRIAQESSDNTEYDTAVSCEMRGNSSVLKAGRNCKPRCAVADNFGLVKPAVVSRIGPRKDSRKIVTMHAPSRQDSKKHPPPPPRKPRARKNVVNIESQSGAPVSPLYYHFSPGTEDDVTEDGPTNTIHKTQSGVGSSSESPASADSQLSSDKGQYSKKSRPQICQMKRPSQVSGSASTLNLQQEILAVVEKHKQGRIAKMRERSIRITASSAERIQVRNSSSTSDVYDLSDDDANPQKVLFTHTSTTTGESISNWSEEGDKSVNMTWVTRSKPRRNVYGTLADPNYRTDETTTETTAVSTSDNPSNVDLLSSDAETLVTKSSDEGDVLKLIRQSQKGSLGSRAKGSQSRSRNSQTRKVPKTTPVQTSEDERAPQESVEARVLRRSTKRVTTSEASYEDTDDVSHRQSQPVHSRGRSKKAVVIQRHQPRRNCQKTESDSETNARPKTPQIHVNGSKSQATAWHRRVNSESAPVTQESDQEIQGEPSQSRVYTGDSGRSSSKLKVVQRDGARGERTRAGPSNGTPRTEKVDEELGNTQYSRQTEEYELSQSSTKLSTTKSSTTKSTKQQSKEQENQAKAASTLTAKIGTMKRKRQLRDLVEQHNRGYEDDIFESTPLKKQKKLKVTLGEWEMDEEGDDVPEGKTPGSARFKTPSVRYQGLLPLSDKKTPYSNLISPGLMPFVDRKHIDQYIHGLQKKKSCGFTQRSFKTNKQAGRGIAKSSGSASLTKAMKGKMADMFDVTPVSDSDPDEDQDYYWSDEER